MIDPVRVLLWATTYQAEIFSLAHYLCGRSDFSPLVVTDHLEEYRKEPIWELMPTTCPMLDKDDKHLWKKIEAFSPTVTVTDNHFPPKRVSPFLMSIWHSYGWKGPQDKREFASVHKSIAALVGRADKPNPRFRWVVTGPSDFKHRHEVSGFDPSNLLMLGSAFNDDIAFPCFSTDTLRRYYPNSFNGKKICLLAPTWHYGRIFSHLGDDIAIFKQLFAHMERLGVAVILRLHDRHRFEKAYLDELESLAALCPAVLLKFKDNHRDNLLDMLVSDFMISNYSGMLTYYYVTGKPSIHVYPVALGQQVYSYKIWRNGRLRTESSPLKDYVWKLPAEEHGGIKTDTLEQLMEAVETAVLHPTCCGDKSAAFISKHLLPLEKPHQNCMKITEAILTLVGRANLKSPVAPKSEIKAQWDKQYANEHEGGYLIAEAPKRILDIRRRWEHRFFKKHVFGSHRFLPNAIALDVGCGDGKHAHFFANYFSRVTAIDFSKAVIDRNNASPKPSNLEFLCADVTSFAEASDKRYDFIFIGGVLMYLSDEEVKNTFELLIERLNTGGLMVARETISSSFTRINVKADYTAYYRHYKSYCTGIFEKYFFKMMNNKGYKTMHVFDDLKKAKLGFLLNRATAPWLLPIAAMKDGLGTRKNRTQNFYFFYQKTPC